VGNGLVARIEEGQHNSPEMEIILRALLKPMLEVKIDYLVLGCSHYPYLLPLLKKIFPEDVTIIDSGEAVARQTQRVLEMNSLFKHSEEPPIHHLHTNVDPEVLKVLVAADQNPYTVSYLCF
jgi:glutamate racemase